MCAGDSSDIDSLQWKTNRDRMCKVHRFHDVTTTPYVCFHKAIGCGKAPGKCLHPANRQIEGIDTQKIHIITHTII